MALNILKRWFPLRTGPTELSAEFYQRKHEEAASYQENNWLLSEERRLLACEPSTLLEIGFGNARFLRQIAPKVSEAIGLDWAISPLANNLPSNVSLRCADVVTADLPSADLVCSADVLEHFRPEDIDGVVAKLHHAGSFNYHVIACYRTPIHLSVFPPDIWLQKFRALSDAYRLVEVRERPGKKRGTICVIANY
jgi:hypothetical protein